MTKQQFIQKAMLHPEALGEAISSLDQIEGWDKRSYSLECLAGDVHRALDKEAEYRAFYALGLYFYSVWYSYTESMVIDEWEGSEGQKEDEYYEDAINMAKSMGVY